MGQKVNPHGLRVGVIKDWDSKWYAEKDFADYLVEDHEIRTYLKKRLYSAGVSKIGAISAPPRRPDTEVLTPSAPDFIVLDMHDFIARLNEIRCSSCNAIFSATN